MRSTARCYDEIRAHVESIPLIDCHDHSHGLGAKPEDPIRALMDWYMESDLVSASSDADVSLIMDGKRSLEERWPVLERAWKRTRFTGYALMVRRALKHFYGEDELTLAALKRVQDKMINFSDAKNYEAVLDEAKILVRLEDIGAAADIARGTLSQPPRTRMVIGLPNYHGMRSCEQVQANASLLGRHITCLDEYLDACREIFTRCKQAGAVAFKDQSAYNRSIHYANASRADAEAAFNWMMDDPRRELSYPDGNRPLGDFLFHAFMRMARDLDLPVQIHTGHMAGIRNEITKTNAAGLTSLIELHRETRFDLFHANWPYSGELLFLGKNYPNVALDFCWTNMVDPIYSQQMFQQAISSMPHGKIHGYGSDLNAETMTSAWAHADLARDNISIALANLVEMDYLCLDEAKEIAYAWLFGNANEFFRLGF